MFVKVHIHWADSYHIGSKSMKMASAESRALRKLGGSELNLLKSLQLREYVRSSILKILRVDESKDELLKHLSENKRE